MYTPNWERIQVRFYRDKGINVKKPSNFDEMLSIAEKLAKPFDFVRVELYSIGSKIYFGELTHYPISGRARIEPVEYDFEFGRYWEIEPYYWKEKIKPYSAFIEKSKTTIK